MTVFHSMLARIVIADAVLDLLDGGAGGKLTFYDIDFNVVATVLLNAPEAFGPANGSAIATANPMAPDVNAVGGMIAFAFFQNDANDDIFECSVTTIDGGGDVELTDVNVTPGQVVGMDNGLTYEAPE
jgi:hypothetical protein